jgi:aminoglycoside phosphotransferase
MTAPNLLRDPILFDAAEARPLQGMSGATVLLMTRDKRHWFVRKAARDPAASPRLRRQLAKQLAFGQAQNGTMRAPEVLGHGEIDGRFYFDMEFVRGTDGVSYLRRANYGEVAMVGDRLCGYLREMSARAPLDPHSTPSESVFDALYTKVCSVHRRTQILADETVVQVFVALERLREIAPTLAPTACHGDLTLENFVVDEHGTFWLIDFLDAPSEHWWHDVTKLHQDLDGGWYWRGQLPIAACVLDYLSRRIIAAATECDPRYPSQHALLLACTFLRVLPYARDADEVAFVKARIEHFARSCAAEIAEMSSP